jgi:hypothetical protein
LHAGCQQAGSRFLQSFPISNHPAVALARPMHPFSINTRNNQIGIYEEITENRTCIVFHARILRIRQG